ncbi:MAG TPA: ABC transporter ATP-binding protein [Bacteroidia bacterium]|nr:ABC transporter ATP-binding protein [Bacteroidia bacterium]
MEQNLLLKIENLHIDFVGHHGKVNAIQDLNLSLKKGETIGIVGESGSGKSVTSLAVMGLLPPNGSITKGNIFYSNKNQIVNNLNQFSEKQFQQLRGNEISMIFQEPMTSLNPVHTCGMQVAEVLLIHEKINFSAAKKRTLQLFEQVMLPRVEEIFKSYPHQLSGGQKQRVMIAMAIACKPQLLIADEPTTALDVTVQQTILNLLKDLQKEYNMGMIFITHDLGVVSQIAQNILVMYKGKTVEHGDVKQIFDAPQHPYTKGLIVCKPPLNNRPQKLLTVADYLNNNQQSMHVKYVEPYQRAAAHQKLYNSNPLLEVQELTTQFITKKGFIKPQTTILNAVDHVSFNVYKGETLGLVGESGCGKSTLGRSILRLIEPSAGKILYNKQNLLDLNENDMLKMRRKMQLIFQDPFSSLNPRITVGNAIGEPIEVHGISNSKEEIREKVIRLLLRVGLTEQHYDRYPHEFSGGQRQRIGIARTLALEPEFIVCDESVSALDVSVQAQVLNLLNELKEEFNLTYIFISHDLSVVKYMCDNIIVMQKGKIVEMAEADHLYRNPQSAYTRKLIEAIPMHSAH